MSKEFKTGLVVIVAICLGVLGVNFLKGVDLLGPKPRHFYVEYKNINGLAESSMVTINGLKVGRVESVSFNDNPEKRGYLLVKIMIEDDFEFSKNSVAKIYSAGLMGGQNLAIVPSYEGEMAVSGDHLKGEIESDLFSSFGEKINPIQAKVENVLVHVDSLLVGVNKTLNTDARESLNRSILGFEATMYQINGTISKINQLLDANKMDISVTLDNSKKITDDLSKLSGSLSEIDLNKTIKKLETTLGGVNDLLSGLENEKGTLGKLMNDDKMYTNLTNASKEMEELLREMKLNPKRFVHFSLFGKKSKPYSEEKNQANTSNQ